MLASLYNGNVHVWNHESQTLVSNFSVRGQDHKAGGGEAILIDKSICLGPSLVKVRPSLSDPTRKTLGIFNKHFFTDN